MQEKELLALLAKIKPMAKNIDNGISLNDQGFDSLELADLYLCIEEKLDIKIPDADLNNLKSVNEILAYLNNR